MSNRFCSLVVLALLVVLPVVATAKPDAEEEKAAIRGIVSHIEGMTAIVDRNLAGETPKKAVAEVSAYVEKNGADMRAAGERFEKYMKGLNAEEAKQAESQLQKAMEAPLEKFLETMLAFNERYPEESKRLDELLKEQNSPKPEKETKK